VQLGPEAVTAQTEQRRLEVGRRHGGVGGVHASRLGVRLARSHPPRRYYAGGTTHQEGSQTHDRHFPTRPAGDPRR
jgi:hypothetical protein